MTPAIELKAIRKRYGSTVALDGLDLSIPRGVVGGVVGPNGAGKTTAFGVIAGLIRPQSGTVNLLGDGPFDARRHAGRITILPQDSALNPDVTVRGLLQHLARLQGADQGRAAAEVARVVDQVGLGDRLHSRIRELSHGMRRRVAVAQCLLGNPEVVLLDEPTAGLDPELVVRMRHVFREQGKRSTLLISSHMLSELEATCDHIVMMERGKVVEAGAAATIRGVESVVRLTLTVEPPLDRLQAALPSATVTWEGSTLVVETAEATSPAAINSVVLPILLEVGVGIEAIDAGRSLEESYMASQAR